MQDKDNGFPTTIQIVEIPTMNSKNMIIFADEILNTMDDWKI